MAGTGDFANYANYANFCAWSAVSGILSLRCMGMIRCEDWGIRGSREFSAFIAHAAVTVAWREGIEGEANGQGPVAKGQPVIKCADAHAFGERAVGCGVNEGI
jgi:hypothetical protein